MFTKKCPSCNIDLLYKTKGKLNQSIKKNSGCRKCANINKSKMMAGKTLSEAHKLKIKESLNVSLKFKESRSSSEFKLKCSISKTGDKNPSKQEWVKEKIQKSVIQLYKENPEIKEKISLSVSRYFKNNQKYTNIEDSSEYKNYRRIVRNLTRRNKKELVEKWNGFDYYDNEYILGYLELNYNDDKYPTIDHKVSILEGFKNNISHKIIADIQNLCITKRILNTQKGFKNSMEFFEKLKGVNSL
jgi:hypothetical protein